MPHTDMFRSREYSPSHEYKHRGLLLQIVFPHVSDRDSNSSHRIVHRMQNHIPWRIQKHTRWKQVENLSEEPR